MFGKSLFLHPEPVRALRSFLETTQAYRPIVMYDGAHVLGLLGSRFQDPLAEGADVLTASTHKTFFGPQRGVIAANIGRDSPLRKLWSEIIARTFPGSTSNHHLGSQLALLAATLEMNHFKDDYQAQVLANARAFARACAAQGIPVEGGEADGYTRTHQVVLRVAPFGDGKAVAARLQENNLITNFQALPGDETFSRPSGIRMGVQEMTRFGMREADFANLARLLADVILRKKNVAEEVAEYRRTLPLHAVLPDARGDAPRGASHPGEHLCRPRLLPGIRCRPCGVSSPLGRGIRLRSARTPSVLIRGCHETCRGNVALLSQTVFPG